MYIPYAFVGQEVSSITSSIAVSRMVVQISGSVGYNQSETISRNRFLSSSFVASGPNGYEAANFASSTLAGSSSAAALTLIVSDTTLNAYPSNSMSSSGYGNFFVTPTVEIGSITMIYKLLPDWYKGNPAGLPFSQDNTTPLNLFTITSGSVGQAYYPAGIYLTSQSVTPTASLGLGVDATDFNYWRSGSYYVADKDRPLSRFELINSNLISADTGSWYSFPGNKINGMSSYQFLTISPTTLIPIQQGQPNKLYSLFCNMQDAANYPGIDTVAPFNNSNKLMMAAYIVWPKILNDDEVITLYYYFKNDLEFNI